MQHVYSRDQQWVKESYVGEKLKNLIHSVYLIKQLFLSEC